MILINIYISHKLNCFNILEWFLSFMNELKNLNIEIEHLCNDALFLN